MNMNTYTRFFLSVIVLTLCNPLLANSRIAKAKNFQDIKHILSSIPDPDNTLTVFDDDDTLSMMPCQTQTHCQYLGTPAWFDHENQLPETNFAELLKESNRIIISSTMTNTSSDELSVLQWIHEQAFHMLIETARGPDLQAATERQLTELGILSLIEKGEAVHLEAERDNVFTHGIFYVSGQNKAEMLKALLEKTGKKYHNIVLIDDSLVNIEQFASAFETNKSINVTAIHYKPTRSQLDL